MHELFGTTVDPIVGTVLTTELKFTPGARKLEMGFVGRGLLAARVRIVLDVLEPDAPLHPGIGHAPRVEADFAVMDDVERSVTDAAVGRRARRSSRGNTRRTAPLGVGSTHE